MNRNTLKDSLKLQPFKPFIINVTDGQKFEINDPDMLAISPKQEIVIVFTDYHYYVIDATKITTLNVM